MSACRCSELGPCACRNSLCWNHRSRHVLGSESSSLLKSGTCLSNSPTIVEWLLTLDRTQGPSLWVFVWVKSLLRSKKVEVLGGNLWTGFNLQPRKMFLLQTTVVFNLDSLFPNGMENVIWPWSLQHTKTYFVLQACNAKTQKLATLQILRTGSEWITTSAFLTNQTKE